MNIGEFNKKYKMEVNLKTIHSAEIEKNNENLTIGLLDWEDTEKMMSVCIYEREGVKRIVDIIVDSEEMALKYISERFKITLDNDI